MLEDSAVAEFLILPGYHLYRMDYREMIQLHQETNADITVSALRSEERQDKGFGCLKLNPENEVLELIENETKFPMVVSFLDHYFIVQMWDFNLLFRTQLL